MSGWTQRLVGLGEVQVALGDVATGISDDSWFFSQLVRILSDGLEKGVIGVNGLSRWLW